MHFSFYQWNRILIKKDANSGPWKGTTTGKKTKSNLYTTSFFWCLEKEITGERSTETFLIECAAITLSQQILKCQKNKLLNNFFKNTYFSDQQNFKNDAENFFSNLNSLSKGFRKLTVIVNDDRRNDDFLSKCEETFVLTAVGEDPADIAEEVFQGFASNFQLLRWLFVYKR